MAMLIIFSKRSGEHRWILEYRNLIDAEDRRSLITKMFPRVNFNTVKRHSILIDRSELLSASFEQIADANPKLLRSCLAVEFEHEVASGPGVLREWLFLVCQALFHPDNSLFLACPSDRRREPVSLEDVRYADPCLYNMDSDIMGLTFINETEEFGFKRVVELCPEGEAIAVNSNNREEYIRLLVQNCFVNPISDKVTNFARGFGEILLKASLQEFYFQSLEFNDLDEMLLGTDTTISVEDWKAHTDYKDYEQLDDQICWFWEVVESMSAEQQRGLLYFWTSVKYLSIEGFSSLESNLCIRKTSSSHNRFPSSSTCSYRLDLPHYPSLAVMKERLLFICQEYACYSFGEG
ncbi:hypothetical protein MKX03_029086 [Papaver bracteatum]|nr:hypothetical protein MKX03_029086 [Papaver bracteatum]